MKRRLPVAVVGLAVLTTLTSCGLIPRGCTDTDAESGVFYHGNSRSLTRPLTFSSVRPVTRLGRTVPASVLRDAVTRLSYGGRFSWSVG